MAKKKNGKPKDEVASEVADVIRKVTPEEEAEHDAQVRREHASKIVRVRDAICQLISVMDDQFAFPLTRGTPSHRRANEAMCRAAWHLETMLMDIETQGGTEALLLPKGLLVPDDRVSAYLATMSFLREESKNLVDASSNFRGTIVPKLAEVSLEMRKRFELASSRLEFVTAGNTSTQQPSHADDNVEKNEFASSAIEIEILNGAEADILQALFESTGKPIKGDDLAKAATGKPTADGKFKGDCGTLVRRGMVKGGVGSRSEGYSITEKGRQSFLDHQKKNGQDHSRQ